MRGLFPRDTLRLRGVGMDRLREFLEAVRTHRTAHGNLLGLLHVLIGRRITLGDGTLVSGGVTWRELAGLLRELRWNREDVQDLGLAVEDLPSRDRQRFWYTVIAQAGVSSTEAIAAGDRLAEALQSLGYSVGPPPGTGTSNQGGGRSGIQASPGESAQTPPQKKGPGRRGKGEGSS